MFLRSFLADVALFKGRFRDALQLLRELPVSVSDDDEGAGTSAEAVAAAEEEVRHQLRSASVHLCLGDLPQAADSAIVAARRVAGLRSGTPTSGVVQGSGMVLKLNRPQQGQVSSNVNRS